MANVDSTTLNANKFMQAFGDGIVASGSLALAANPTAADVLRIMRVQAGTEVTALMLGNSDMDSGTPDFAVSIGYHPVDSAAGPTADVDYFQAAGDTVLGTANAGKLYCNFPAITFDKDVYITMTVGVDAATFVAGTMYMTALGKARGTK
jgi:hypothetical protein